MKRMMFALAAAGVLVFAGASPALAFPGIVKVPFRFVVNGRALPAGTYMIRKDTPDASVLSIQSMNNGAESALFATEAYAQSPESVSNIRVEFRNYRGQYFLWKVTIPDQTVREVWLQAPQMDQMLAKLNLLPGEPALGASAR